MTPPPVDEVAWAVTTEAASPQEANRTQALTADYARAAVEVGAELGVPTLDLNAAFAAQANWRDMCVSGRI